MNMVRDFESRSPVGNDNVLSKLRERLKEKEKALEVGIYGVKNLTKGYFRLLISDTPLYTLTASTG